MLDTILLGLILIVFGVVISLSQYGKWSKSPPGPRAFPIVGNLLQMGKGGKPLENIQKWRDEYGSIYRLQLGQYRAIVINGYDNIKEAYNMWEFSGRNLLKPFDYIGGGGKNGLLLSEGQAWTEQRRFALRNLRDFGFGKKSMESLIQEDITELTESFHELKGEPIVPHRKFSTAVLRSLWEIVAGERFKYGDPRFQSVLDGIHQAVAQTSVTGPVFFLPWIADIFPKLSGWSIFRDNINRAKGLIGSSIKEHQESFKAENIRDFIDAHMKEQKETHDPNSSFYKEKGEKHLLVGCLNLFAAGSETTSNTIVWALLYLMRNPEVQKKLYQEITKVIGNNRMPSLDDRDSMPYAWAVMEEVLRMSSLLPFGVFHNTMEDVNFKGYFIPKDTIVLANFYGVHYDKMTWGDPTNFRPERFLTVTDDGKYKKKTDAGPVIAFSIGKRVCLGEVLARNNFFLYLTSLVQKFEFTSNDELNVEAHPGFLRAPQKFSVNIRERN